MGLFVNDERIEDNYINLVAEVMANNGNIPLTSMELFLLNKIAALQEEIHVIKADVRGVARIVGKLK